MIQLEDIKYRIDQVYNDRGATCLVYIDARRARDELTNLFGRNNWQFRYTVNDDKSVHGVLMIKEGEEWLHYEDVGYCDNDYTKQPLKDAVSDATKRCAVQVGVGDFLYDAPFLWIKWEGLKVVNGKVKGVNDDYDKIIRGNIEKWYNSLQLEKIEE